MPRHYPNDLPRRALLELQLSDVEATIASPESSFLDSGSDLVKPLLFTVKAPLKQLNPHANMCLSALRNAIYDEIFREDSRD